VERELGSELAVSWRGGDFDPWDLEVRCGTLGTARALLALEEHGSGRQMGRWRVWPRASRPASILAMLCAALAAAAWSDEARLAALVLAAFAIVLSVRIGRDCALAAGALDRAVRRSGCS
jgi:hypothetical protein